jgi:hypothetical protein
MTEFEHERLDVTPIPMKGRCATACLAVALAATCAPKELASETPRAVSAPPRALGDAALDAAAHAPRSSPDGSHYSIRDLRDLIGRRLSELDSSICGEASGFRLTRGLMIDGRALAVRSCSRFRGPHDAIDADAATSSKLTIISDGGRIVFAVASKEYSLAPARRVSDALMNELLVDGCEQVHSTELAAGFSRCSGAGSWAALSRVELVIDGGSLQAVVLEVATDRSLAGQIAAAHAELAP